ncbi:probable chromosome segregation () [Lecanosticta acicola]|uniref:Probable chromosome segregation ( ) n=1 Tax=Lecanosticta acicola TaxID=111012 RepID=A0AAI9E9Z2_9PEZI|nr:probable chromosome segregation () [Lecanosticta acicola]
MAIPLRGRPAHAPGPTFFSYTPNGKKLITAGPNGAIRVFEHGSDSEPTIIDVPTENHLAAVAANDFFIIASEEGDVTKYSLVTNKMDDILIRCSAPPRDLALSPDGEWLAVASDELEIKIVNVKDTMRVMYLREQTRPAKHLSFDISGTTLTASCADGMIYVYSLSSEQPQLTKRVDGLLGMLDVESENASRPTWHPDGRAFVVPTQNKELQVVARNDWSRQKVFSGLKSEITALAWSPNGALLVTADLDKALTLWDARTQKVLQIYSDLRNTVLNVQWHPKDNVLSYTNNNGELFIREDFVPDEHKKLLRLEKQPAPLTSDPLLEVSGNARKPMTNGVNGHKRTAQDEYLDDLLGPDAMSEDGDGFIEDDDGAGYAEEPNLYGKRAAGALDGPQPKRQASCGAWQPQFHPSFQPGSTPWKGNRRYLCLNLTGFVWTVDQETHHTVTVEFYDRQEHRDFHFTDPYRYDKACLNEKGSLFSCPSSSQHPAVIYYRPHETWTARVDWRTELPASEEVTSLSLSDSCVVATTSTGYVRIYSLFGLPLKVYRQKTTPAVTCASWRDYVMTVGNGPVGGDGTTRLLYTIEHVKRDEICQSEDILALPEGTELRSVFFSDKGDPCIYDSDGVLLVLLHWRTPGQAKWVPLLDTKSLDRLAAGKKEETYWPVAVAEGRFHCIILKGGEQYPYFPRPLLSDFEFKIPISSQATADEDEENGADHQKSLEEQYVRSSLQHSLLQDLVENTNATSAQKTAMGVMEREVDKALLQLIASECREGEERGMKALEIASLMRDRTGKMLEAAGKIAQRFQRDLLGEKINELAERRIVGLVDDDD